MFSSLKDPLLPVASEGRLDEETFAVRRATSLDDLQWVVELATEEGFRPRKREAECYFAAGFTQNFFIGELNGERIAFISVVSRGESVICVGYYIVAKPHRGQGYGYKMWKAVFAGISDQCNIQLMSVMNMVNVYQKTGFHPRWMIKCYVFTASHALEGLASSKIPSSVAQILPASKVDFEKLFTYGVDMLGTSQACKSLLAGWLSHAQESSWVAIGNKGEIVGYLIMSRTTRFPKDGYRVAPFFADSATIAQSLLKVAVGFATATYSALDYNTGNIFLEVAADISQETVSMLENEIGVRLEFDLQFMDTKETSNPHGKVYGLPCINLDL